MAMDSVQEQAFKAGSGGGIEPFSLEIFCIGLLIALLFIWAAWGMVDVYKGWANEKVREVVLTQFCIRAVFLILICIWMFIN
ncbi:TIGR03758 family integrating conjugative element protein [Xenorhabdus griffiniae]|uniref:TIGR03758 family integrating conjugative element protein n=1 Tax=Xenorhabdus griffiniae TaxID=351672 RepID=A0ABY9XET0_9GAMM|nr:TIGR03758 family integrating conjugative element protein [Xenorhabdus griffiniae]MBD1225999.1 TIGR03758 family integrating conjugative element protein [Xenorhabdus griffiniae]MBE8585883.1 TIGR03758 family integrating conjugative element protein [Xenorhabdus griffiniae]WMV71428.1 TIGR03758 family integrating conjugative element protein [Xenorhabdus griffiniae]WNH01105.1 TIGR03758 family integrating conjugative element protein [Xenorhabdus griffiniae]